MNKLVLIFFLVSGIWLRAATIAPPSPKSLVSISALPASLVAPAPVAASFSVQWEAATNVTGYKVYCGTNLNVSPMIVSVGLVTNVKLSGLEFGQTYKVYATALDASGFESAPSNFVTNYTDPKIALQPYVFRASVVAPNTTNVWQVSTNGTTWSAVQTVVTNKGQPIALLVTNDRPMVLMRLR